MKYRYLDPKALTRVMNLPLVARGVVEGFIAGLHRSPFHGSSVEFSEYRKYVPGDDLKHLDWKAYGKTEKLYVKLFEEETNLRAHLLLDTSASMGYASSGQVKQDYAAFLAASLAYLMIRQQDTVGLATFDHRIRKVLPPGAGALHLREILTQLEKIQVSETTGIAKPLHDLAEMAKRRGLVILISDLFDDPAEILRGLLHFRHRRHEVIVFNLVDPDERDFPFRGLTVFRDMETGQRLEVLPEAIRGEVRAAFGAFVDTFRKGCAEARIDYVLADTSVPYETLLAAFLTKRARVG
ncbi:MAG: DUF58 domain-containing protein [Planctomycetes bacterium]|nr:DUF58 domain-containing protein [Planctomycetota bacterium]